MADIDELLALLEDVRVIKKAATQAEKRLQTMLVESEGKAYTRHVDSETGSRDVDALAKWLAEETQTRQQEHAATIRQIIRELEKEEGFASLDKILERAVDAGIRQDEANKEIAWLVNNAALIEPVRGSGKYHLRE